LKHNVIISTTGKFATFSRTYLTQFRSAVVAIMF